MIELTPLARPYAKAVFASALDAKSIDTTKEELKTMALISTTTEVPNLIEDPTLSKDEILKIYNIGHRDFGENRVQEAQKHWVHRRKLHNNLELHLTILSIIL